MKFKKSQSGRSMVEMLGVLAIIGVLSVGGIAGYSLSMRRHRANQIVDTMSKYAVVVYSNCQQKIMNGELTKTQECYNNVSPKFEDAGVGTTPAGVTGFGSVFAWTNQNSVDAVNINLYLSDEKLCQAIASIAGTDCTQSTSAESNDFTTYISFKQN